MSIIFTFYSYIVQAKFFAVFPVSPGERSGGLCGDECGRRGGGLDQMSKAHLRGRFSA